MKKQVTSCIIAAALCIGATTTAWAVQSQTTQTPQQQISVTRPTNTRPTKPTKLYNFNLTKIYGFARGTVTGTQYQGFYALSGENGENLHFWVHNRAKEPAVMKIKTPDGQEFKKEIAAGSKESLSIPLESDFVDYTFSVVCGGELMTDIDIEYRLVQDDTTTYQYSDIEVGDYY